MLKFSLSEEKLKKVKHDLRHAVHGRITLGPKAAQYLGSRAGGSWPQWWRTTVT